MNTVHVCYSVDDAYLTLCKISIFSAIVHKHPDTKLVFHILTTKGDLSDKSVFDKFKTVDNVEIDLIELSPDMDQKITEIADKLKYAKSIYTRWTIPFNKKLQDINKILFMDADAIPVKDLSDLYNTDLEGNALGECKSQYRILHGYMVRDMFMDDIFVNSGVILMDCNKLNEFHMAETMFQEWLKLPPRTTDEIIITKFFLDKTKFIPPHRNVLYPLIVANLPYLKDIFYWNSLYNTNYKSMKHLLEQADIIHMFGRKDNIQNIPKLNKVYNLLYSSMNEFLKTGIINCDTEKLKYEIVNFDK